MCANSTCPVHVRQDSRGEVTESYGGGHAFTYIDDVVIATLDNPDFTDPLAGFIAAVTGNEHDPGMFMTIILKVGDRAVGDLTAEELAENQLHREEFAKAEELFEYADDPAILIEHLNDLLDAKHDEAVAAFRAGLFN